MHTNNCRYKTIKRAYVLFGKRGGKQQKYDNNKGYKKNVMSELSSNACYSDYE